MNKRFANQRNLKSTRRQLKPVYAAVLLAFAVETVQANPLDATVVSGQASFASTANTLTVTNTPGTIINWQSFSIGQNEITKFVQQSASSSVLNRVISNDPSNILGTLQSNGRVFLVNPNGIVFGAGAIVDVAGLVASTLNLSNSDFLSGRYNFTAVPNAANISNAGNLTAADNGQIYLIAPNVENSGVITASNGEILLVAGNSVELLNSLDPNLRVSITAPAGDATNVGQLIAESGKLGLFGTMVKNSGTASADSATLQGGKIVFRSSQRTEISGTASATGAGGGEIKVLSDMQSGTVQVSGTLDASAPTTGNGGFIDTSAAHVQVQDGARISTLAANGVNGNWLIDPTDFYVSALDPANGSSWMSNATLSTNLGFGNVTIQTLATGAGNGDIFVNGAVSWNTTTTLTLNAHRNVEINSTITSGIPGGANPGHLTARADLNGSGIGTIIFGAGGHVTLQGGTLAVINGAANLYYNPSSYTTPTDYSAFVTANLTAWMLVNNVGLETGGTLGLQAINTNLAGNYALGRSIDASVTNTWNAGSGFVPLGNSTTNFTGKFNGNGHSINLLAINRSGTNDVGLFGVIGSTGIVVSTGLNNAMVTGGNNVGGMAGSNYGNIWNSYVSGNSISGSTAVGGMAGHNYGGIYQSWAGGGSVNGIQDVGGMAGNNSAYPSPSIIDASYVVGTTVNGTTNVGGFVGRNGDNVPTSSSATNLPYYGQISNSYSSSGLVSGTTNVGGLVGLNQPFNGTVGAVTFWDSVTTGQVNGIGAGDAGSQLDFATFSMNQASLTAAGMDFTNTWWMIDGNTRPFLRSEWSTNIANPHQMQLAAMDLGASYTLANDIDMASALAAAGMWSSAGFVPIGDGITNFTGQFDGLGHTLSNLSINSAGGDAGLFGVIGASGIVSNVGLIGSSVVANGSTVGGLAGNNAGTIINSYVSNGNVSVSTSGASPGVGGLVGHNSGAIINSYVSGGSVTGNYSRVGGLVGSNAGTITNSYVSGGNVVNAATWSASVGGLAGYNSGAISNSYVDAGTVVSGVLASGAGGLVGYNAVTGSVSNSYVSGVSVVGSSSVGGLVGINAGDINNSYASGGSVSATSATYIGGLVGANNGTISNTYVSGGVVSGGLGYEAGIAGLNNGSISNSFWDTGNMNPLLYTVFSGVGTLTNVTGLSSALMMSQTSFTGWDFTNTWWMVEGSTRPFLRSEWSANIVNPHQLQLMAMNLGAGYTLGANLDMAETSTGAGMWGSAGFVPVGTISTPYTGNFDGQGHTIDGLFINRPSTDYVGLFGRTSASTIKDVSLTNVDISGNSYVGSLVGWHQGNLANSNNATGTVTGTMDAASLSGNHIGGLVGMNYNFSIIDNCSSGSTVSGDNYVGGLVGTNQRSTLSNSSASGNVTGTQSYAGGLVGDSYDSVISNGIASGNVNGVSYVGGLVGRNGYSSNITNGIASGTVSGTQDVGGLVGLNAFSIDGSHATGSVTGTGAGTNVGGLVGNNYYAQGSTFFQLSYGAVSNSYATTGTVTGVSNVGGLVGYNYVNNTITASNAGGAVTGNSNVGGLAGNNERGSIITAYATGTVTGNGVGSTSLGGLVGNNSGTITNSYATGASVSGVNNVGGLVGYNWLYSGYANDINGSYVSAGAVTGTSNVGGLVGNNTGTLTNSHFNITGVTVNGANIVTLGGLYNDNTASFNIVGQYTDWLVNGNKSLSINNYTSPYGSFLVAGSNSFTIGNIQGMKDLLGFADNAAYTFTLTSAIDMSALPEFYVPVMAGNFDGGNFSLSNFTLNRPGTTYIGLFGEITGTSAVSNVRLIDAVVSGGDNTGALAGFNKGTITASSVGTTVGGSTTVSGTSSVGGLVGNNSGTINTSTLFADGGGTVSVTGTGSNVGGLVGTHSAFGAIFLQDSGVYANSGGAVNVSGVNNVGGLVGYLNGGLDFSYVSNATITASGQNIGGLAGNILNSPINSYFNVDAVTTNGVNNVTRGGLYATQYSDWYSGGLHSQLLISSYSTSLVLQLDGSYGISDLQGMKDMLAFADYSLNNFSLLGSIDLGTLPGFNVPILAGSFNGNNLDISNLSINLPNSDIGLFGNINFTSSVVSNLNLVNAHVTGSSNVGALAGLNYGNIDNVSVSGTSTVSSVFTGTNIGGLVGYNNRGNIYNSDVAGATVTGATMVGGLVGLNYGTGSWYYASSSSPSGYFGNGLISNSFVTNGSVIGSVGQVGGLVGENNYGGIDQSHVTNTVVTGGAAVNVGGLVGYNLGNASGSGSSSATYHGSITNSYVSGGTVTSSGIGVGGLAGQNWGGLIYRSRAENFLAVSGGSQVGGLVGFDGGEGSIGRVSESFVSNVDVTGSFEVGGLVGRVFASTSSSSGGQATFSSVVNSYASGGSVSGTSSGSGVGGLVGYNGSIVSNSYASGGVVSGGYYSVGGLVGYNGGTVSNSYVNGGTVNANNARRVGGLVGNNSGSISNSYVLGTSVSGLWSVGGLVGGNGGDISGSFAENVTLVATVSSSSASAGGLVGANSGSISNSYVNGGTVSANSASEVGGLVGYNSGSITNSYTSGGLVSGAGNIGGLVGYNDASAVVSNSFWDTETTTLAAGFGQDWGYLNTTGVSGLTSAQRMTLSSFTGWSIANTGGAGMTWRIYEGRTGPLLTSFLTQTTVTANNAVKTYDGVAYGGGNGYTTSVAGATLLGTFGGSSQGALNAGTYVIDANGLYSDQLGYDITGYTDGTLTIDPKVVALSGSKIYDGTAVFTGGTDLFVATGVGVETLVLSGTASTLDKNVGNTDLLDLGTLALADGTGLAGNYMLTGAPLSSVVSITPLALTIGAVGVSRVYDALTGATVTLNDDRIAGDVLSTGYGSAAFLDKNAGTGKQVDVSGITLGGTDAANYLFNTTAVASADITQATLTLDAVTDTKVYDGTITSSGTVGFSGLFGSDSVTGLTQSYDDHNVLGANGSTLLVNGGYTVNDGNGGLNYIAVANSASGTITPASLTATANDFTKTFDAAAYSGGNGITYSGFVNSETSAVLGGSPTYSGDSQGAVNAGSYVITPGGLTSTNYIINFVDGTLTIDPAGLILLDIAASDASKTFGDTLTFTGSEFTPVGLMGGDTISSVTLNSAGAVDTANVGNYAITPSNAVFDTGLASNYDITYADGTLTVTARPISIAANAITKVYGDLDADVLTFNVGGSGLASFDDNTTAFTGALSHGGTEDVGSYAITQGSLAANPNYTVTGFTGNSLDITPATLTVQANDLNKILLTSDPLLTYTVYGLKFTDTAASSLSGSLKRETGETVGAYQINQDTVGLSGQASNNYTMNYMPGTFTILAPTVISEIVDITDQNTGLSDEEEDKLEPDEVVAAVDPGMPVDDATQSLPMCQ